MNKRVVITGASSGIGKSLAEVYAKAGYSLVLIARRAQLLEDFKVALKKSYSIEVDYLALDLATADATQQLEKYFSESKINFDIFINNAGLGFYQKFSTHTSDQINKMIELNITSLTHISHFCVTYWRKNNIPAHLVNIASVAAYIPIENYVVYSATKAYVKSLSLSLRSEGQKDRIKVSCVCPGGTKTEFFQASGQTMTNQGEKMMMSSEKCAEIIYHGVKNNKSIIVPGFSNKISVLFSKILPEDFLVKISTKVFNYFMKNA